MSSLLMVLLLLTLGSLLLEGLNLQQRALLAQTASETQAIRDTAIAHSALQWGKQQVWSAQVALACREQAPQGWRACLRIFGDGSLVLSSASGEVQVWQSGEVRGGCVFPPTAGAIFARSGRRAYVKCPEASAGV
jgi:hypothetical protein